MRVTEKKHTLILIRGWLTIREGDGGGLGVVKERIGIIASYDVNTQTSYHQEPWCITEERSWQLRSESLRAIHKSTSIVASPGGGTEAQKKQTELQASPKLPC
jgi:hypothetical protein